MDIKEGNRLKVNFIWLQCRTDIQLSVNCINAIKFNAKCENLFQTFYENKIAYHITFLFLTQMSWQRTTKLSSNQESEDALLRGIYRIKISYVKKMM